MPVAELPTSAAGWLAALAAAFVGFVSGFLFLTLLNRWEG